MNKYQANNIRSKVNKSHENNKGNSFRSGVSGLLKGLNNLNDTSRKPNSTKAKHNSPIRLNTLRLRKSLKSKGMVESTIKLRNTSPTK